MRTRPAEELTETVEVTEEVDDEQQIQDEVGRPLLQCDLAAYS